MGRFGLVWSVEDEEEQLVSRSKENVFFKSGLTHDGQVLVYPRSPMVSSVNRRLSTPLPKENPSLETSLETPITQRVSSTPHSAQSSPSASSIKSLSKREFLKAVRAQCASFRSPNGLKSPTATHLTSPNSSSLSPSFKEKMQKYHAHEQHLKTISSSPTSLQRYLDQTVSEKETQFSKMLMSRKEQRDAIHKELTARQSELDRNIAASLDAISKLKLEEEEAERKQKELEEKKRIAEKEAADRAAKEKAERDQQEKKAAEAAAEKQRKEQQEAERLRIKKETEEKEKALAEKKRQEEVKLTPEGWKGNSSEAEAEAKKCLDIIMLIKSESKPFVMANSSMSNVAFKARMEITRKIGQLTTNKKQIIAIVQSIYMPLEQSQSQNEHLYHYLMDLTAKQIIKQAEKEVSVKRSTAFPLAAICILLYNKHTPFLDILMGRLIKRCPYVAPLYYRKEKDETKEAFMKRLGYRESDENTLETEIQYGERMCGILALYAAILQSRKPRSNFENKVPLSTAWKWLARVCNMKPRRITPLLVHTFLDTCGHELVQTYGQQALKLCFYIHNKLIPAMPEGAIAGTTRLRLFLEESALGPRRMIEAPAGSKFE